MKAETSSGKHKKYCFGIQRRLNSVARGILEAVIHWGQHLYPSFVRKYLSCCIQRRRFSAALCPPAALTVPHRGYCSFLSLCHSHKDSEWIFRWRSSWKRIISQNVPRGTLNRVSSFVCVSWKTDNWTFDEKTSRA